MKTTKNTIKKWPYILDHPYRILIFGSSGSRKTNALLNLVSQQDDIEKIYLHAKDLSEPKNEFFIKKSEDAGTFIEYSNTMDDVYENTDDYNPNR